MNTIRELACTLGLALWIGGLTFYSAVVVPIGTDQLGSTGQGAITQVVTIRLNQIGLAALTILVWDAIATRSKPRICLLIMLIVSHAVLYRTHAVLGQMFDPISEDIADYERFYAVHRVYLLVTSFQWFAGLAYLVILSTRRLHSIAATGSE